MENRLKSKWVQKKLCYSYNINNVYNIIVNLLYKATHFMTLK